jgi:plastocyanin domain-containing protein
MKILLTLCLLASAPVFAAPRRVEIQVTADGYKPDKLTAKPGEQLVLVFKPAASMGCCDAIVVPAANFKGKVEKGGKPLEVPVTMPASGKLAFACSMNMCQGEVAPK